MCTRGTHTDRLFHPCPNLTVCLDFKRSLKPRPVIFLSLPGCFTQADRVDVDVYFVQIIREMRWEEVGGIVLPVVLSPWAITLSGKKKTQRQRRLPQTSAKSQLIAKRGRFYTWDSSHLLMQPMRQRIFASSPSSYPPPLSSSWGWWRQALSSCCRDKTQCLVRPDQCDFLKCCPKEEGPVEPRVA